MNMAHFFANTARRLEALFPGYFPEAKHNHYADFGYPVSLTFDQLHGMFRRNGIARAGVEKTILKTWQDNPELWETEDPDETKLEREIRQRFDDLRFWQRIADADRMSLVGRYSGVILRVADGQRFNQPVARVRGGLTGLVEVIPAWEGQLTVSTWDTDETSLTYGQPRMFAFNEAQLAGQSGQVQSQTRSFELHPDRVVIWSRDGTVHGTSALEPGYNDLLTMEKVSGAGGEGFWKNAKSAPVISVDKEARLKDMADAMGVSVEKVADAMNEQVEDFTKGFDKMLMLQGMKAETLGITLPSPEHFFAIALQSFAASLCIPVKILVGSQTGERASTEDAREWGQTCNARRTNTARPAIAEIVRRLERFGILPERDWHLEWTDLTESTMAEKLDRAAKMTEINSKSTLEAIFLPDEIRAAVDMEPIDQAALDALEQDEEDPEPTPPVREDDEERQE